MPPKKSKTDNTAMRELKQAIKEGVPQSLYLFHGEEAFLREHYLGELKKALLPPGLEDFNLHTAQGKDCSVEWIAQAVDCLPMMSGRTLVEVTDFDLSALGDKQRERLMEILNELPEYCCLVFVYDLLPYKLDGRSKLAGLFKERGALVNFQRQEQGDLVDWVRRRFKALGKEIDPRLALELISLCGDLMTTLIGEIEKVGAYARGPKITRADIDAVAAPQLDAVVFEMTDAIGAGSFDQAASVLGELFQMQEPPQKILWSLGRQMRQIYSARLALEGGKGSREVSALWGIKPYPADKLMRSARRFTLGWCRQAVVRCAQTDLDMKSTGRDGQELLTTLLLELAALSSNTGARR